MEKRNLVVLLQPPELLIIGGAASGTLLVVHPPHVITAILKGIAGAFTDSRYTKQWHVNS